MKPFETYQHVEGTPMTERDKEQIDNQSWGKGKWDNFVRPFLPKAETIEPKVKGMSVTTSAPDCSEMTFVDMGCNAGLFLKYADNMGFGRIIGVDSNDGAVERGQEYLGKIKGNYAIINERMEDCIDSLPVADYTVLANAHYYYNVADWLKYLDRLQYKTINCIIVTAKKRENQCNAGSSIEEVINYFRGGWEYKGRKDTRKTGAARERTLWGLHFKSKLERVPIDSLDNGNSQQRGFWAEMDEGKLFTDTEYYRRFLDYRVTKGKWTVEQLDEYFEEYVALYKDIVERGMLEPIIVKQSNMRIVDGNHRHDILRHLGHESIIVRWVL